MEDNNFRKIAFILVILATIVVFIGERIKLRNRHYYSLITEGTVTEIGSRAKTEHYVAYQFIVHNKRYFGSVDISFVRNVNTNAAQSEPRLKFDTMSIILTIMTSFSKFLNAIFVSKQTAPDKRHTTLHLCYWG
jgi:hypothetical protein